MATPSRTTYEDTISCLNSRSLRQALKLVSLLSAIEFEGRLGSPVHSLLNSEQVRLVAEAVIKSKAAWYKDRPIGLSDLPVLLNGANEALDDKRLYMEVVSGGERQEMLYKMQRFLSRLAYIQIRPQQTPFIALGRTFAILEVIPKQHIEEVPLRLRSQVVLVPDGIREVLGISVADITKTHLSIMSYFGRLGSVFLQRLPSPPEGHRFGVKKQNDILKRLAATSANNLQFFRLTSSVLGNIAGEFVGRSLGRYAAVFGRPISVHRELLKRKEFQVGPEGHRLSSLDRFPLVTDEGGDAWYVPNVRSFARSAPEIIHFALNETWREPYESVRGALLEAYLRLMFKNRAPQLVVIPESRWKSPRGGVDGPDLLIIDHSEDPSVIGVEVKSRRMVPGTRYELLDEHIVQNYEDLWKALRQLPGKVAKIFSLAGDYEKYKQDLMLAKDYPVYFLGVAGEAPYLFGELVEYRRQHDPEFPLYGFDEPCGVMSVDSFERMLEASVQKHRPIVTVLREYLEDCRDIELSSPMAENFRHADLNDEESFGFSYLEALWPEGA